jgi:predicted TIM-barrel fold metal-dependent hydrolase
MGPDNTRSAGGGGQTSMDAERTIIVSVDTHVGPRVVEDLRGYCPSAHLDAFDAFASTLGDDPLGTTLADRLEEPEIAHYRWNQHAPGHYDVASRLKDMDRDGVACEVVFHLSTNGQPLPFISRSVLRGQAPHDQYSDELEKVGLRIYNRWLVDFCSVEPERHVGMCYVPMWDIDASINEVVWGHEHGLKGVNFPAPTSRFACLDDPAWDPFFATCAERNMVLNTHTGGGEWDIFSRFKLPVYMAINVMEVKWLSRRGIWQMIFSGTFDRHPDLRLAITELGALWWQQTVADMDAAYLSPTARHVREHIQRMPSEYAASHLFVGGSFMSRPEAEMAIASNSDHQFMWGTDYPHAEGTWMFTEDPDEPSTTRLSLANTFHGLPEESVRKITGDNAIGLFRLDRDALTEVAQRIGPTMSELQTAPDLSLVPDNYHGSGFRTGRAAAVFA